MPVRLGSKMRQKRTTLYGWKDGNKFCLSLEPREAAQPFNTYDTASDALKEASTRVLPISWEEPV